MDQLGKGVTSAITTPSNITEVTPNKFQENVICLNRLVLDQTGFLKGKDTQKRQVATRATGSAFSVAKI